ncbi:MAG TPA: phage tail tube protein, partial [Acidocella sp.]|nr:phage tail tube protein [Acidocella sp.]
MTARILTRTRFILAELEATYGVDPVPTPATNAILCKTSLAITPMEATQVKRDLITPYMGDIGALLADTYVKIDFEVELSGSGTAGTPPGMDPLLQLCGFAATTVAATSVTYAPVSTNFTSGTLYFYGQTDGGTAVLHKLTGCRGDFTLDLATKAVPYVKFTIMGLYNAPTELAAPAGFTYAKFAKPVIPLSGITTATIGGLAGNPSL